MDPIGPNYVGLALFTAKHAANRAPNLRMTRSGLEGDSGTVARRAVAPPEPLRDSSGPGPEIEAARRLGNSRAGMRRARPLKRE